MKFSIQEPVNLDFSYISPPSYWQHMRRMHLARKMINVIMFVNDWFIANGAKI